MRGRKIEIYYSGNQQTCLNCYQPGHKKKDCENQKREWIDYVVEFVSTHDYEPSMYGKWHQIVSKIIGKQTKGESNIEEQGAAIYEPEVILDESRGLEPNQGQQNRSDPSKNLSAVGAIGAIGAIGAELKSLRRGRSQSIPDKERNQTPAEIQKGLSDLKLFANARTKVQESAKAQTTTGIQQNYRNTTKYKKNTANTAGSN